MAQLHMLDFFPAGYLYRFFDQRSLCRRVIRNNTSVIEEREGGKEAPEDPAFHEDERQDPYGLTPLESEEVEGLVSEGLLDNATPAAQVIDAGGGMGPSVTV